VLLPDRLVTVGGGVSAEPGQHLLRLGADLPLSARAASAAACAQAAPCRASRALCSASAAREGLVPAGLSGVDPLAGLGACPPGGGVRLPFGAVIRPRTIG
jgi:hypothetical protein